MENQLFNLKFTAKQLAKSAAKCEKLEKDEKLKVKKAIEKGNVDGARIYAENSIRQKNQAMNFLRLSSRVDAVASRLEMAIKMKQVSSTMAGISKQMEKALNTMDIEQISRAMDQFERQFERLDHQSAIIENGIGRTMESIIPQDQVENLIEQVADEHHLSVESMLDRNRAGKAKIAEPEPLADDDEDQQLYARLQQLRS
eukprot:TRINITY_DN5269_c0_g1_i1.p1 TRINITY_DN5269_c0_g1~~TRINITY_DN5269_c0_g1_i1.p1  ORF type:complete len:200 (+),score=62.15 TRINITY_DN5269_c0_g1_i1:64-663(+)